MAKDTYELYLEQLARRRAPALSEAEPLVVAGRFDEADRAVTAADDSIYGAVALAALYRRHLEEAVARGFVTPAERAHAEALFRRALYWARSAYPEPHTAFEADDYASGRAQDRAELVRVLGYEPSESG